MANLTQHGIDSAISSVAVSGDSRVFQAVLHGIDDHTCLSTTIWVRTRRGGTIICFKITGNGPGITGELQSSFFDPFSTTRVDGNGTGLGLSVAHRIIWEKCGGSFELQSLPNRETTLTRRIAECLMRMG
jgi:C4-dicarboxylate-specific signal transduction histidine kinase